MFNWGFIGSGTICYHTSKQMKKSNKHNIVAVYSRTFSHAEKFAKTVNATPYNTIEEFFSNKRIEGIYIGTPHSSHYKYAKMALEKGIPVLLEKTFTLSYESSLELIKIAREHNTYICEAMWTWFAPSSLTVKDWINENRIGKPLLMKSNFCVPNLVRPKERIYNPLYGGGSLLDLGVYPIAYAYNLFGYPNEIIATAKMKNSIDVDCKVIFKYNSGLVCELFSSLNKIGTCSTIIKGEKGTIKIPAPMHCGRKAYLKGNKKIKYRDSYPYGLYENEFSIVADEIKQEKKESLYIPFQSTLDVMKIIEEVKKQIGLVYNEANSL